MKEPDEPSWSMTIKKTQLEFDGVSAPPRLLFLNGRFELLYIEVELGHVLVGREKGSL